jgi:hypothetical protein
MANKRDSVDRIAVLAPDAEVRQADSKTERSGERYGWGIKIAIALLLPILVLVCIYLGASQLLSGWQLVSAASILGVSIAFTGVLVPCVFLILSRRSVISEMLEDVADIQGPLKRGRVHGLAIQQRRQISKAR